MFQLHDKTRRRICLAGFVLLGVLPTLLVGGWCLSRHLPGCVQAEAEQLGRQLGLDVKLGRREAPSARGRALRRTGSWPIPRRARRILRCRLLEIAWQQQSDQQGQRRAVLAMTASQPEVEAAARSDLAVFAADAGRFVRPAGGRPAAFGRRGDASGRRPSQTLTDVEAADRNAAGRDARRGPFPPGGRRHARAGPHPRRPQPPGFAAGQRLRALHRRRRIALQRAGDGAGRTEAAGPALPLPRLHLGQRNARRLGRRSHRPTGRIWTSAGW